MIQCMNKSSWVVCYSLPTDGRLASDTVHRWKIGTLAPSREWKNSLKRKRCDACICRRIREVYIDVAHGCMLQGQVQ